MTLIDTVLGILQPLSNGAGRGPSPRGGRAVSFFEGKDPRAR